MATTRSELIAALEQTAGVSDAALDFRAGPDEWSVREILAHLVDDEMYVIRLRLERIIVEEQPRVSSHHQRVIEGRAHEE